MEMSIPAKRGFRQATWANIRGLEKLTGQKSSITDEAVLAGFSDKMHIAFNLSGTY